MPVKATQYGRSSSRTEIESHRANAFECEEFLDYINQNKTLAKRFKFIYFETFKTKEYICGENQTQLYRKFDSIFRFEYCNFLELDVNVSATPRSEVPIIVFNALQRTVMNEDKHLLF